MNMATDIKLPGKMEFFQHGSHIEIVRKWFDNSSFVFIIFATAWNWFVFQDLAKPGEFERLMNDPFSFNLLFAIFPAAGIALMYYALAGLLNRTRISVSREKIMVRHGPLPWLGNTELEIRNLKRLYIKKKMEPGTPYEVHALTQSGKTLKLVAGLAMTSSQASYLKQEITRFLGIKEVSPVGTDEEAEGKLVFSIRGAELEIVRRWFDDRTVGRTVIAVIVTGFAFAIFTRAGSLPAAAAHPFLFHLILYIPLLIGAVLAYGQAAEWLNRTYIVVNREYFSVRHGPLPWPGNLTGSAAQIKRLHTKVSRWSSGTRQYRRYTYNVFADRQDGKSMKIAGGFESVSQAMKVEQEMAKYFGLKPEQGAPQSVPVPEDLYTYIETELTAQQRHQTVTGSSNPGGGILAVGLFTLVWNGFIWWVGLMMWEDSHRQKHPVVAVVFFTLFALIGFGMIALVISETRKFIRKKK